MRAYIQNLRNDQLRDIRKILTERERGWSNDSEMRYILDLVEDVIHGSAPVAADTGTSTNMPPQESPVRGNTW